MAFEPEFNVTAKLLQTVELIAALRERIAAATLQVAWIPALQKDARVRNTHCSTRDWCEESDPRNPAVTS